MLATNDRVVVLAPPLQLLLILIRVCLPYQKNPQVNDGNQNSVAIQEAMKSQEHLYLPTDQYLNRFPIH